MTAMTFNAAAASAAPFKPLDTGILNAAIPAFFIGRNSDGFWVARDANGQIGGIFLLKTSAICFVRRNSEPGGCATIYPSEEFELDLENKGNPLVRQIGLLQRLTRIFRRRATTWITAMTALIKHRLGLLRRFTRSHAARRQSGHAPDLANDRISR